MDVIKPCGSVKSKYTLKTHLGRSERSERRPVKGQVYYPVMGECVRECWQCEICGFCWLKGNKVPYRCGSQKCRSTLWNRTRKSQIGRPDKGMVKAKQRMSPTLDLDGNHHPLCSCILCLTDIWRRSNAKGRPPGKGDRADCLRGAATGIRTVRRPVGRPRAEVRMTVEALIRGRVGVDAPRGSQGLERD